MKAQSSTSYLVLLGVALIILLVVVYVVASNNNAKRTTVRAIKEQMANNYPIGIVEAELKDGYIPYIVVRNNADRAMYVSSRDVPYVYIGLKGSIPAGPKGYLWGIHIIPQKLAPGETAVLEWDSTTIRTDRYASYTHCTKPGQVIPVMFQMYPHSPGGAQEALGINSFEGVFVCEKAAPDWLLNYSSTYYTFSNPYS